MAIGLCLMTAYFVTNVKTQLWKQSINTILEATRQGRRTLAVQLNENYEDLGRIADRLAEMQTDDQEKLNRLFQDFNELENDIHLVLSEDLILPLDQPCDQQAITLLDRRNKDQDVIDPHISSVTGMDVFDLVLRVHFADGEEGYLIKEFEVSGIADTFTLSFYEDAGFSYVVDTQGNVLIRAAHPNSNKTVQNLLDMLSPQANDPQALSQFAQALKGADTGWAIFTYEGERTVFCFTPVGLQSDWVLISIIPEAAVNAQTNALLRQALTLILSAVLGISLLVLLYLRHRTKTQQRLTHQTNYISHLYNALPEAVALISVDPPYHLLQLNREGRRLLRYAMENSEDTLNQNLQTAMSAQDYARFVRQIEAAVHSGQKVNIVELMKKRMGKGSGLPGLLSRRWMKMENRC